MTSKKLNILVTGGAGFIGSHLVDALIAEGHRVKVLDVLVPQVHKNGMPDYLNPQAEYVWGDVCDVNLVNQIIEGVHVVYHEAAEVGVGQSMYDIHKYVRANDLGTSILLESIVKNRQKIQKLIVASSMSIYGEGAYCNAAGEHMHPRLRPLSQLVERRWEVEEEKTGEHLTPVPTPENKPLFPTSVYAITKQDQEQFCLVVGRAYGIPTVALRYFNAYGPRQALSNPYTGVCAIFSSRLLNDQAPVIFEDGEQTRDFVHVSDIVKANLLALSSDRADYSAINVGTGIATSVRKMARMIAEGLGKNIEPEIVGKYREGDIRHCVADITQANNLLNYKPGVHLEDGIPELIKWVKGQSSIDDSLQARNELEKRELVK